jgi:hypothetical protein
MITDQTQHVNFHKNINTNENVINNFNYKIRKIHLKFYK